MTSNLTKLDWIGLQVARKVLTNINSSQIQRTRRSSKNKHEWF